MLKHVSMSRNRKYGAESGVDTIEMEGQPAVQRGPLLVNVKNISYPFILTELTFHEQRSYPNQT